MSTSSTLQTARRIAELARRGEGGERVNAEKLLADFMAKHGLTDAELESQDVQNYRLEVPDNHVEMMLIYQCITSTADTKVYTISKGASDTVRWLEAAMTAAQYAEASMKVAVMLPLFRKEQRTFFHAFLFANELLGLGKSEHKPTEEEIEHLRRAKRMSDHVMRGTIRKALGPGVERE